METWKIFSEIILYIFSKKKKKTRTKEIWVLCDFLLFNIILIIFYVSLGFKSINLREKIDQPLKYYLVSFLHLQAFMDDILKTANSLFEKYFSNEPTTYAIMFK